MDVYEGERGVVVKMVPDLFSRTIRYYMRNCILCSRFFTLSVQTSKTIPILRVRG